MKKFYTLLFLLMAGLYVHSQVALYEDFSTNQMPPQDWTVEGQNNWRISNSSNAGAQAPEGKFTWTPQFVGLSRLVSPAIDVSGSEILLLSFKHMIDHYSGSYTIGISTRSGGGDWTDAHTQTVTGNIAATDVVIHIENDDVGQADFQFSLFFNGNSYNINDWYFDNIELLMPYDLDLALASLDVPAYFFEDQDVSGKVTNLGLETVQSFELHWQIDENEIFTTSFSGLELEVGESYNFVSEHQLVADPGSYTLSVWISNVNGNPEDDNPDNDMITSFVGVPTQTVDRKPLFEEFTSSTCGPCATFNNNVFNAFVENNADIITLIKYQMSWPGSGDPYYTPEGGDRRNYYGVNAVPNLFTDGRSTPTNAPGVNNALATSLATPAFVEISAQHMIEGDLVTVQADITSYVDLYDVTLHLVVVEETTYGNVGSNGETSFKHVMMKMMPDAFGSNVSLQSGVSHQQTLSVDMSGTFVEEMDDLLVVVFLQDDTDKSVFNSEYSNETGAFVAFDPEPGSTGHTTDLDLHIAFNKSVNMIGGEPITNDNVGTLITLADGEGIDFPFMATINDEKTEITIIPDGLLDSFTWYYMSVEPVENEAGVPTPTAYTYFETGIHVGIDRLVQKDALHLLPNPAKDQIRLNFSLEQASHLRIFILDAQGQIVDSHHLGQLQAGAHSKQISLRHDLASGVYVLKLESNFEVKTTRMLIIR